MEEEKLYYFKITICGWGEDPDEAWDNAVEGFSYEPGQRPVEFEIEEDDDDVQGH